MDQLVLMLVPRIVNHHHLGQLNVELIPPFTSCCAAELALHSCLFVSNAQI